MILVAKTPHMIVSSDENTAAYSTRKLGKAWHHNTKGNSSPEAPALQHAQTLLHTGQAEGASHVNLTRAVKSAVMRLPETGNYKLTMRPRIAEWTEPLFVCACDHTPTWRCPRAIKSSSTQFCS